VIANAGTELEKAQARLETAVELCKIGREFLRALECREEFYRRELKRIMSEMLTK
jgi:hypothetical protein